MILSAMKYVQGYVYVHLTGYAPERFLNLCSNRDILIWNLKPCEDGYYFCVSVKGFRQLKPILRKTKTHIRIEKRYGMPFTAFRYRKRKIFCAGIILFGVLLYYLSGFIWNIEVNGNSYLSEEVILDFLEEEQASFGTRKSLISCEQLEESLRSRYDEVIWTSIKIYGTKMTVDIQENLLPEEEYVQSDDTVYDIVAAKDGIISEMITRSGTPQVASGVEVLEGELLVSGRLEIFNDAGEVAQYLYHSADADILAQVTYAYQDVIETDYIDEVPTGEVKTEYILQIFGKTVGNPFFHVDYEHYTAVSDAMQLHFTDNFYLPVFLMKKTYQEYEEVKKTRDEEAIRQIATKNLNQYLTDLEEKGIQIIEKDVIIENEGQKYVAVGTVTVYESIVSYKPTEILEITSEEGQTSDESD